MTDITIINKEVKKMKDSKKPGWKERLSNWTTAELMRLALFFQCIGFSNCRTHPNNCKISVMSAAKKDAPPKNAAARETL